MLFKEGKSSVWLWYRDIYRQVHVVYLNQQIPNWPTPLSRDRGRGLVQRFQTRVTQTDCDNKLNRDWELLTIRNSPARIWPVCSNMASLSDLFGHLWYMSSQPAKLRTTNKLAQEKIPMPVTCIPQHRFICAFDKTPDAQFVGERVYICKGTPPTRTQT